MKKRILALLMSILTLFSFTACDWAYIEDTSNTGGFTSSDSSDESTGGSDSTGSGGSSTEEGLTYSVRLMYDDELYEDTEGMQAQWTNGFEYHHADFVDGVAEIQGLDGDYTVSLINLDDRYVYNPNGNRTSNFTPNIEIPIYRTTKARGGKGTHEFDCKVCRTVGIYRDELTSASQVIFYEFEPTENGVYTIESWINTSDGKINPKLDVYYGSSVYKQFAYTLDDGGYSKGYTRNFKYSINVDDSNIGGVWTFAIHADEKNGQYPVNLEFALMRDGGFKADRNVAPWILPSDLYGRMGEYMMELQAMDEEAFVEETANYLKNNVLTSTPLDLIKLDMREEYPALKALTADDYASADAIHNALEVKIEDCDKKFDSTTQQYVREIDCYVRLYVKNKVQDDFDSLQNAGSMVGAEMDYRPAGSMTSILAFRGENFALNSVTGVYHVYNEEKYASDPYGWGAGYGPVLYGKITANIRFIGDGGEALTAIEYHGNKALTVSNGTENYKLFIEGYANMKKMADQPIDDSGQLTGMPGSFPAEYVNAYGYADFVNSDGVVPVTPELKEFFQKYSVHHRLFNDGNGYAELYASPQVDALEEDQWLFACCFYQD